MATKIKEILCVCVEEEMSLQISDADSMIKLKIVFRDKM